MPDVQDLTQLGAPQPAGTAPAGVRPVVEKPYDPAPDRENVRGTIALALVWTLVAVIAIVVLAGVVTVYACQGKDACTADTVEMKTFRIVIELVFTPLLGLVGAVTGFYFGEKSAAGKSGG